MHVFIIITCTVCTCTVRIRETIKEREKKERK